MNNEAGAGTHVKSDERIRVTDITCNATARPYSVVVDGKMLCDSRNKPRCFASHGAAHRAGITALERQGP